MAATYYSPFIPAFNSNGAPLAGARLAFFVSGTSTPTPVYADEALTTQLPNPVPSDAAAKYPPIYLDEAVTYRVIQTGPDGVQIGDTIDPYVPGQALKGDAGPTGPANSTYTSLSALKAAAATNASYIFAPPSGSDGGAAAGTFLYQTAGAPYTADGVNVVKLDAVPLTIGALVRQGANGIALTRPAGRTTVEVAVLERVTTSGYGSDAAALQAAIDSGAREVIVNNEIGSTAEAQLRSDQILRFAGGRIVVPVDRPNMHRVLYNSGGTGIQIIDPSIDASARSIETRGIQLINVTRSGINGGSLRKANVRLESTDPTISRDVTVSRLTIDMMAYPDTAVVLSGIRGVRIIGGSLSNGGEGVGIYNGARGLDISGVESFGHVRDGFLINAGFDVAFSLCQAHNNGQSGFTTQRQVAGTDTRVATFEGCRAEYNDYDGFDIRGKNDGIPWGVETAYVLNGCHARFNVGCGFYVVLAEATMLGGCVGSRNGQQGLLVDQSDRVIVNGFRAISNASAIASGINKAGVLAYNSLGFAATNIISGNWDSVQQDYGFSATGSTTGSLSGGNLGNNASGPFMVPMGVSLSNVSDADTAATQGYFFEALTTRGTFRENGDGVPMHFRPKGSTAVRNDGGNGEVYISNGLIGGNPSWSRLATV